MQYMCSYVVYGSDVLTTLLLFHYFVLDVAYIAWKIYVWAIH